MRSGTGIGVRRTATPRCSGRAEPIRGRADSLSGEDLDDVCSALDLAVEALDGVVGPDLGPVLAGEGREGRQVGPGVDQHLDDSEGKASLKVSMTCLYWAATSGVVWAKMVETSAPAGSGSGRAQPG